MAELADFIREVNALIPGARASAYQARQASLRIITLAANFNAPDLPATLPTTSADLIRLLVSWTEFQGGVLDAIDLFNTRCANLVPFKSAETISILRDHVIDAAFKIRKIVVALGQIP